MILRRLSVLVLACSVASLAARPLPELSLKDLDGHKQKLSALRPNIVVLSFWATWCGPCQEELPRLSLLNQAYAGKPVHFVAVSIDENKSRRAIADFLAKRNIHIETWMGATAETMEGLGLSNIVPSTLILDEGGQPVTRITGEACEEDIRSRLDWLLRGRPGPAPERTLTRL